MRLAHPPLALLALTAVLVLSGGTEAGGQTQPWAGLRVRDGLEGREWWVPLRMESGTVVFAPGDLAPWGWRWEGGEGWGKMVWERGRAEVELWEGVPYLRWNGDGVHLAQPPLRRGDSLWVPVQVLTDVLTWKLPQLCRWRDELGTLELGTATDERNVGRGENGRPASVPPPPPRDRRVVVIDAGHGGSDPGAKGPTGVEEKTVALALAKAIARELASQPDLEVRLTRETDELVPLWQRGELATRWKGDRYGIFLSVHANALPASRSTRGFETYFLSPARTEHERRVAALENSAVRFEGSSASPGSDPELGFILNELRNLDYQLWSSLLAELVQNELARVHPGPDRGVKQGPFAVLTNTPMPAVLLEVGFITNREEERLLLRPDFQSEVARAVARAVTEFFRRYPPVQSGTGREEGS